MNMKQTILLSAFASAMVFSAARAGIDPKDTKRFLELPRAASNGCATARVAMRDGTRLGVAWRLPPDPAASIGTALHFTPYQGVKGISGEKAPTDGRVHVNADSRGSGTSEGKFIPYEPRQPQDAYDLLSWIAAQPWSKGKITMTGGSYSAATAFAALRSGHPALKGVLATVMTLDPYTLYFANGVRISSFKDGWHRGFGGVDDYNILASHPDRDAYWEAKRDLTHLDESKAWVYYEGGWFDICGSASMETYNLLKRNGRRVFMRQGPWDHGVNIFSGEIDFSKRGGIVDEELELDFLRCSLTGETPKTAALKGDLLLYVMGSCEWRLYDSWPVKGTKNVEWPFMGQVASASFRHDPKNPVPTCGGRAAKRGLCEQSKIEARKDVLVFTGEALKEKLDVIGDVRARLAVSSGSTNCHVAVKLVDVYPDGKAYNVVDSICRVDGLGEGKTRIVEFHVDSTAYTFMKGHRLRVQIAGSNAPHFEVYPNPCDVTIHSKGSRLILPTVPAGALESAWIKGETDKDPLSYKPGETVTFKLTPMNVKGEVAAGEYFLEWKRSDDFGTRENGREPFDGKTPFVYRAKLAKPGFVRLEAWIVDKAGKKMKPFFDGGAGVEPEKLATKPEPKDFDAFWKKQYARLDRVPMKADLLPLPCENKKVDLFAVRIDCAGLRPVTGYLSVPKDVKDGKTYPARLQTHGYSGTRCVHGAPTSAANGEIILNINAHGLKLPAFGATDADTKALRFEIASGGCEYAFDPKQNADPETAYFNGMVLRVKRALQYLKTVKGWNGKDLLASGGSQGGLQTIWAAGCGEGVTRAESGITWCCDMAMNNIRRERKISSDGWYIPWTESMGYYDAANFAKRIPASCRTVITRAGLGDYCCPPMGLAKLYNNIPGNKEIHWMQGSQHGYQPPAYAGRDFIRKAD